MTNSSMDSTQPWNPSRGTRIVLGLATLWPPIYFVLFIAFMAFDFFWLPTAHSKPHVDLFMYIFPLHCFTMLVTFGLTAVYIVHAVKRNWVRQDMRIVWILILFMGNMFAFPVYWWLYLRPSADRAD